MAQMALKVRRVRQEALVRQGLLGTLVRQGLLVRQEALDQRDLKVRQEAQDLLEAPEVLVEQVLLALLVRQVHLA